MTNTSTEPRYEFHITARNFESSEALANYIKDKVGAAVQKLVHHDVNIHVACKLDGKEHFAEVSLHAFHHDIHVSETADSMYSAVDRVARTLSQNLQKQKEKSQAK